MRLHQLCRSWTRRTCLTLPVVTVKNKNIFFPTNKSDVHEPVDYDTCIVLSKAKNEDLSAQSQASTAEQSSKHCHLHAGNDSDDQPDVDEADDDAQLRPASSQRTSSL